MSKSIERMVIERALKLMRNGWCRVTWAEDAAGNPVEWYSKRAVRFCAEGAIKRATKDLLGPRKVQVANRIIRSFDTKPDVRERLMAVNDGLGKKAALLVMCNRLRRL